MYHICAGFVKIVLKIGPVLAFYKHELPGFLTRENLHAAFASLVGVTSTTVSRLERTRFKPSNAATL
jgi:hypothetical protein